MSLFTAVPVVQRLERWSAEHLGQHDSLAYDRYLTLLAEALVRKSAERRQAHDRNGLFGMSGAGGCLRANALSRAGVQGAAEDGGTRATWEIGHLLECMALAVLEASGFTVTDHQAEVRYAGLFKSNVDGILRAGPVELPYPLILSVKTSSFKMSGRNKGGWTRRGFTALPLDGVHQAHPGWYVQSQLEMAGLGLAGSLVLVVAKDMIAAMRDDPIMQESGSLTWYAEHLPAGDLLASAVRQNAAGLHLAATNNADPFEVAPIVYARPSHWATLPAPGDTASGWGGPNKEATGTFNYCFGCRYAALCAERSGQSLEAQLRRSLAEEVA